MQLPKQTAAVQRQVTQQPINQQQPINSAIEPSALLSPACQLCSLIPDSTGQAICAATCSVGTDLFDLFM